MYCRLCWSRAPVWPSVLLPGAPHLAGRTDVQGELEEGSTRQVRVLPLRLQLLHTSKVTTRATTQRARAYLEHDVVAQQDSFKRDFNVVRLDVAPRNALAALHLQRGISADTRALRTAQPCQLKHRAAVRRCNLKMF